MAYIRLALDSLSPKIFETQSYRVTVMKVVVLSLMLSMGMIQVFIIYLQCYQGETVLSYHGLIVRIICALRAFKLITDAYMYQLFVRQLMFFLRKKRDLSKINKKTFIVIINSLSQEIPRRDPSLGKRLWNLMDMLLLNTL
jgi:hypothetical protein